MKEFKKIIGFFIITISLSFCAMKQEFQTGFPQEIKSAYFEKQAKGTNFYIEFKAPLSAAIKLEKIYFRNQEAKLNQVNRTTFVGKFYPNNGNQDLILDADSHKEYGNKAPVVEKPKFDLKAKEAILEYKNNNKTQLYKIINPKEKQ